MTKTKKDKFLDFICDHKFAIETIILIIGSSISAICLVMVGRGI